MKVLLAIILAAAVGYFLGSCNFAIIIVKIMKGVDIREMGSRNAGLTNTYRCCGPVPALLTLIGDLCKGVVAVGIARLIAGGLNAGFRPEDDTQYIGYIAGLFAIIGHVFPCYFQFKGGKGVLVGIASLLMISPKVFLCLLLIFIAIFAISKYVSLSSIIATLYCPLATLLISWIDCGASFGRSFLYMLLSLPMAALVLWMHRTNIERLMNDTEPKFDFAKYAGR